MVKLWNFDTTMLSVFNPRDKALGIDDVTGKSALATPLFTIYGMVQARQFDDLMNEGFTVGEICANLTIPSTQACVRDITARNPHWALLANKVISMRTE